MDIAIALKVLVTWLAILALAVANGVLRERVLVPFLGAVTGLILSGILLSALILLASCLTLPWFGRLEAAQYLHVGLVWLVLTVAFEFMMGRLVRRRSWRALLAAYTFEGGNLWPLVLIITAAAPLIAARLMGLL